MLEALKAFVASGNSDAVLLGLVFTTQLVNEYDEDPDNRSAEYWHKKLKANHELSNLQHEVAMGYEYIKPYRELLDFLLVAISDSKKIVLPSPLSIKEVTQNSMMTLNGIGRSISLPSLMQCEMQLPTSTVIKIR